jgi:hypothetical protein
VARWAPLVHRRPPAAARWRRRGARLAPPCLHSPASIAVAFIGKGENPNAGWWEATVTPGSPYRSQSRRCGGREGRRRSYWWPWRGGRRGSTPVVAGMPLASPGEGKEVKFSSGNSWTGSSVRASFDLRANSPLAVPSRAGCGAAQCGREQGKK